MRTVPPRPPLALHKHPLCNTASALLITMTLTSLPAAAQNVGGTPLYGNDTLTSGFSPDPHVIAVNAGGPDSADDNGASCTGYIAAEQPDYRVNYASGTYKLGVFVRSSTDTTLIINAPDGSWHCNDDFSQLDASSPGIVFDSPASGQYDIWVGTYGSDAAGTEAQLVLTELEASQWQTMALPDVELDYTAALAGLAAELTDLLLEGEDTTALDGRLEATDATLPGYGYADTYTFEGEAGQLAIVDLQSVDFDTYLLLRSPGGEEFTNDDYEGNTSRSLLNMALTESGTWEIITSSFMGDETGTYTLNLNVDAGGSALADAGPRSETGSLSAGDETLGSGEYRDIYEIEGRPGQQLRAELRSDDFDTFLILQAPSGETVENDDADSTSRSLIETELSELGTYRVVVTSYDVGSTGDYALDIAQDVSAPSSTEATRDVVSLSIGENTSGSLSSSDVISESGMFEDAYSFTGNAGDTLRISLRSSEFDTYLRLITPAGEAIENDDFEGNVSESAVEISLPESGRYRVVVSSYAAGIEGAYTLSATTLEDAPLYVQEGGGGQIYGIFAGISDYPGTDSDLSYTDQDAVRARDALINGVGMAPDNGITLLNDQATIGNLRDAIARIASRIRPEDTFVLFYSGHGSRIERSSGPSSSDPDGIDETIELYDGSVLDDELSVLFDSVNAGTSLLVLDSCFSGGFAKDIVSRPGRMGLFSSEEDVTSQVAAKFRAGGYLSVFFEEALEGFADFDENGELTALELSEYLHDRFRHDVKSKGLDDYVLTGGPQSGYQHLVVDRGGVGPYNVLFNH